MNGNLVTRWPQYSRYTDPTVIRFSPFDLLRLAIELAWDPTPLGKLPYPPVSP